MNKSLIIKKNVIKILKSEWKDRRDRTLKMLIESNGHGGWGIDMSEFETHINMNENNQLYIFHEIVDGRFDADKLDYLQRDARNCNVPYALGLDKKRFFSCITCLPLISRQKKLVFGWELRKREE